MHKLFASALLCVGALPLFAQTKAIAPAGLEAPWDVRKMAADLQHQTESVQPLLGQLNPQTWVNEKGAPSTYIVQWQTAQQQLRDAVTVAQQLAQHTESLSTALDTYFRLEALELSERALAEGARQYDQRQIADKLAAVVAHNFDMRQQLREYIRNLAVSTEENFRIADSEAQRCRSTLSRQPTTGNGQKRSR
jgi:hypothetical protein